MAKGWCVKNSKGELLIHTVSSNERGAIVNWLLVDAGITTYNSTSDKVIYRTWEQWGKFHNATVVQVNIEEVNHGRK